MGLVKSCKVKTKAPLKEKKKKFLKLRVSTVRVKMMTYKKTVELHDVD